MGKRIKGSVSGMQRLAQVGSCLAKHRIKWALLLWLLLFNSCSDQQLSNRVTAFLYTDSTKEEKFIRQYNELFPRADLELQISRDKRKYDQEIQAMFQADNLTDIFSVWQSKNYQNFLKSDKLADFRYLIQLDGYNMNLFNIRNDYQAVKILPIRYNYGNVMLINIDILSKIDLSINIDSIVSYEDFRNLAELTTDRGYDFLVVGDPNPYSFGDLFFSAAVGWLDRFWLAKYSEGRVSLKSEQLQAVLADFYDKFDEIFPNPSLANLNRSAAEKMFLDGEVLMIIGSSEQLLGLMQQSEMEVDWFSFPQTVHQNELLNDGQYTDFFSEIFSHYQNEEKTMTYGGQGAVLDDVLGVGASSAVTRYDPMRYNEVSSVLHYYTGLYASGQRIRKWGLPTPASHAIAVDEKDQVMRKTIEFLDNISYIYYRPSIYLSEDLNSYLNKEIWSLLQGNESPGMFVDNLIEYTSKDKGNNSVFSTLSTDTENK